MLPDDNSWQGCHDWQMGKNLAQWSLSIWFDSWAALFTIEACNRIFNFAICNSKSTTLFLISIRNSADFILQTLPFQFEPHQFLWLMHAAIVRNLRDQHITEEPRHLLIKTCQTKYIDAFHSIPTILEILIDLALDKRDRKWGKHGVIRLLKKDWRLSWPTFWIALKECDHH